MKEFKFTQLEDGTYSVKIYGIHGTASSEVNVPESYCGAPVTEITFGKRLDANFMSLHIPASMERVIFNGMSSRFAGKVFVDEDNPNYSSDGMALYSKDGWFLYRLFPRYIDKYTVMEGTEILAERALRITRF